ncbi:MAG: hypothetical protein ACRCXV_11170 [Bacteroidales bacterium]
MVKFSSIIDKGAFIKCYSFTEWEELARSSNALGLSIHIAECYKNEYSITYVSRRIISQPTKHHINECVRSHIEVGEILDVVDFVEIDFTETSTKSNIDWEQRRYEIAKDMLGVLAARDGMASEYELNIERAVTYADELIKQLKEE